MVKPIMDGIIFLHKTIKLYNLHNYIITPYTCSPYNYISNMLLLLPFN